MSVDERNLLATAFKNLVGQHRIAFRTVNVLIGNSRYKLHKPSLEKYRDEVATRLNESCEMVMKTVKEQIMTKPANKEEARVYFLKMIGDYCRYKTETLEFQPEKREAVCKEASKCYEDANAVNLGPCSSTRLGLILNMSVFYYEIC